MPGGRELGGGAAADTVEGKEHTLPRSRATRRTFAQFGKLLLLFLQSASFFALSFTISLAVFCISMFPANVCKEHWQMGARSAT